MTSLSNLPEHLVGEQIFTRLPVKDLIVLTSVCKSWLAFISSPSFVESHVSLYQLNPDNHSLMLHPSFHTKILIAPINFSGNPHISSIFPIPASGTQMDSSDRRNFRDSWETFVGSINGLVCFYRPVPLLSTTAVIWNPVTRRYKNIRVPHFNIKQLQRIFVGFGFNWVAKDYKIVCIWEYGYVHTHNHSYQFHMYSCNDNSWKELKHDFPLKISCEECVIVRGNPYWACVRPDLNYLWVKVNVQSEEIRMFHGPEYVMNDTTRTSVMALGDSVAEAVFSPGAEANQMIHLYTFEENSGVWMRIYSLELFGLRRQPLSFMCYYKNGKIIYTTGHHKKLFFYNVTSREVKNLMVAEDGQMYSMPISYTESLASVEGMVHVPEEAATEERQLETVFPTTESWNAAWDSTILEDIH